MPQEQPTPSFWERCNQVTWYSKLGAIILFLGVIPSLTFYIGMQYQAVQDISSQPISNISPTPATQQPMMSANQNEASVQQILNKFGFSFTAPPGFTLSAKKHGVDYDGNPAYIISIDGPPNPKAVSAADEYHAVISINAGIEGTMGPDDAAPKVTSNNVTVGGVMGIEENKIYTDGYSEMDLSITKGKNTYYMRFPTTHPDFQQYTGSILNSFHFQTVPEENTTDSVSPTDPTGQTPEQSAQIQQQTQAKIDAYYASQNISLPVGTSYQTVSTSNGYSFEWPTNWTVDTTSSYIKLYDYRGAMIATVQCPVERIEGPYGVYPLKTMQRVFSTDQKVNVRYREGEGEGLLSQGIAVTETQMFASLEKDGLDIYQKPKSCEIDGSAQSSESMNPENIAALRHIYDSWK